MDASLAKAPKLKRVILERTKIEDAAGKKAVVDALGKKAVVDALKSRGIALR